MDVRQMRVILISKKLSVSSPSLQVLYGNFVSKNCLNVILLFNRSVFHSLYIWTVLFVVPLEISVYDFLIIFSPSN
jgi:hypothetical protein